jgi:pimeloyl-ACP methyl ester carboxylesterase
MREPLSFDVPVAGGTLRVAQWGSRGPVIFACHGITANHTTFFPLADQLGEDVRLIAPDLRGRGRSAAISGPFGMAAHAADVVAVLDHLSLSRADILLGQSMGGFVGAVAAAQYPERVRTLLLVDGGVPLARVPPLQRLPFADALIEWIVRKLLGPSIERLEMRFASREAYRDFWRAHPAFRNAWSPYVERYVDYDLVGLVPALHSCVQLPVIVRDARTQLIEDLVPRSLLQIRQPVRFLRAPRGVMDGKPLYPPARLAKMARGIADFRSAEVEDCNHFTILFAEHAVKRVVQEIHALLEADPRAG